MGERKRRRRVEPTDDWEQLGLLCRWPEQLAYEELRPLVLFGLPVADRAEETGSSRRTLYRRVSRFESEGMDSLFAVAGAKRRTLPPAMRRLIVDLKAEHPPMRPHEISTVCYVRFGRRPDYRTVERVLAEEPIPLRMVRRFPLYHETGEPRERRTAVVRLHAEGWNVKSIASYLETARSTVYRALRRWMEEGVEGLDDRPNTGGGVRRADLKAYAAVRRLQENPHLGEFRIHAALAQMGIHLSPRTCGRILAVNRKLYRLEKPKGPVKEKKEMPFLAARRHQYWTADVRYIEDHKLGGGMVYVISILDNYSRAILASSVSRAQDQSAFLRVLHRAVEKHGSPEALVTDGGGFFRARRVLAVYEALGVRKEEIERRRPWQSYIETNFNVQRRMADWHFARAETWAELVAAHARWVEDFNAQKHWRTGTGPTAGDRPGRCSRGSRGQATGGSNLTGRSSRNASRACWTLWATSCGGAGRSTARRAWPGGRPHCGSGRRRSSSSTEASRSPATRWSSRPVRANRGRSRVPFSSRPRPRSRSRDSLASTPSEARGG